MAFQFRRGTDAERQSITPKTGEPLFVTDTGKVYVGDGTTQGGNLVSIGVSDDDSPSLGGNLDLNGNDIIGTGNINIDGFITATGNINLGDGAEDNVIVGGVIESNLIPGQDNTYDLGANTFAWRNGFFNGLSVDGEILSQSLSTDIIYSTDSTILWDTATDTLNVSNIVANSIQGNVTGSILGDDSATILDITSLNLSVNNVKTNNLESDDQTLVILNKSQDGINFGTYKGSLDSPEAFEAGDTITSLAFQIIDTNIEDRKLCAGIAPFVSDNADFTTESPATELLFLLGNNTTSPLPVASISSTGILSANVLQTKGYDDSTNYPSDAEAGSIIFDTSDNHFYGFTGTSWVQLDN